MNLSDLFSIVIDSITLNLFKISKIIAGKINVVPKIIERQSSAFI